MMGTTILRFLQKIEEKNYKWNIFLVTMKFIGSPVREMAIPLQNSGYFCQIQPKTAINGHEDRKSS